MVSQNKKVLLPPNFQSSGQPVSIETQGSLVIVGANGSGKTRLGTWLESNAPREFSTHRIAAQKSLTFRDNISPIAVDRAENSLFYGYEKGHSDGRLSHRWNSKPNTTLLDDFDKLMVLLFSDLFQITIEFYDDFQENSTGIVRPLSKLHILQKVWEYILPHRKLIISSSKIQVKANNEEGSIAYSGTEMSDGERVIFYQIGQALCAPKNSILIIDEPELHLHKSIQNSLWNAIENERPDCLFIYLTHDLDFASSRRNATKIGLKGYNNDKWDWYIIPDASGIPEELFLNIIGSRKPILFIEGSKGSEDYFVYSQIFSNFTVEPVGSCRKVIDSTGSFNALSHLHSLKAFGLIDRDYRSKEETEKLEQNSIFTLKVAEVENLFLLKDILSLAIAQLCLSEKEKEIIESIENFIFRELEQSIDNHALASATRVILKKINNLTLKSKDKDSLKIDLATYLEDLNSDVIFEKNKQEIKDVLNKKDYDNALFILNHKGLVKRIGQFFNGLDINYVGMVKAMLNSQDNAKILAVLKKHLPQVVY